MRALRWIVPLALSCMVTFASASYYDAPMEQQSVFSGMMQFVGFLRGTMRSVTVIAGATMLMMSVMQFKKHRDNPLEVPLSNPVALVLLGLALIGITYIPIQYG